MKYTLLLLLTIMLISATTYRKTGSLDGTVIDINTKETLVGATIFIYKKDLKVIGTNTDVNGKFSLKLAPGVYEIHCSYTGFETNITKSVEIKEDLTTNLEITMSANESTLSEVVVSAPAKEMRKKMTSASVESVKRPSETGEIRTRRSDATEKIKSSDLSGKTSGIATPSISLEKSMSPSIKPTTDAIISYKVPLIEKSKILIEDKVEAVPPTKTQKAGQLTAGEWNDLQNWGNHWNDLLADGEIEQYENMYHFYPKNRYAAILQNEENFPIADVKVRLVNEKGQNVWQTRTDNAGKAELWSGLYDTLKLKKAFVEAEIKGKYQRLGEAKPIEQGISFFKISADCKSPNQLDIVWAVDATGSMSDEIDFLKSEVLDVISRVKQQNERLSVRMGSVFYRDLGDDYLTRKSPLSADIKSTVNFIQDQSAGGGGDYPEAVHTALEEAIGKMEWSDKAIARICFLVLDASPHQTPEVIESLQKSIRMAAEKGIRIVPLSASGIQKDTEFLMKFFGLATNGTYLFLTDHSGIGGKHLEPTTEEYKVEMLNDLLVRVITEYAASPTCDGKSVIRFADTTPQDSTNQNQQSAHWEAFFYPNPASDQFNLSLPIGVDVLTIYNSEGKSVKKMINLKEGTTKIEINGLPEGFYLLRLQKGNEVQSGKLMVVRS
jgi:CarboxypepD_reg-like domain/Secretion system C-terminal sorting domain/von Willebrand factor type A domain